MTIAENLLEVKNSIAAAARRAGRDPAEVRLVVVSKTVPVERLKEAVEAGQHLFGENYLQEAQPKIAALGDEVTWHFVGALQTKKAKGVVGLFDVIHSVDRLKLAQALDQAAAKRGLIQDILIQVNLAGEETKSGVEPEEAAGLLKEIVKLPHLRVTGLMTMPPWFSDPERVRPYFRALRELRDRLRELSITDSPLSELSMGMTGDFEVAVEEGATLLRVGTAVFGERPLT
jgi:pyridoxal phosphate enzyme (YggS family)